MKLETGKVYIDGNGRRVEIGGATKARDEWVWGLNGFWYERDTGRCLRYAQMAAGWWAHVPSLRTADHLVREIT